MDRAGDLRADYERLGQILRVGEGTAAVAAARERRLISAELERLEATGEVPFVDEVAERRHKAGGDRPAVRRRKSG